MCWLKEAGMELAQKQRKYDKFQSTKAKLKRQNKSNNDLIYS